MQNENLKINYEFPIQFYACPTDGYRATGVALLQRIVRAQWENNQAGYVIKQAKPFSHVCETCGEVGYSHPDNGYCGVCNTDDWLPVNQWNRHEGHAAGAYIYPKD